MSKPFSWSHSALNLFETCPYKYYRTKHLGKWDPKFIKDEFGAAATEGIRVHGALEQRIKSSVPLPADLSKHESLCAAICAQTEGAIVASETQHAIDGELKPCEWFSKNPEVWSRAVLDILIIKGGTAVILDWKNGKEKEDMDQLKIFSLFVFAYYPQVMRCITNFIWLKTGNMTPKQGGVYTREEVPSLWQEQFNRLTPLIKSIETDRWPTKKNYLCNNYCIVNKVKQCPIHQ